MLNMLSAGSAIHQPPADTGSMMHHSMDPRIHHQVKVAPASSSRILYDIPCKVCRDHSSGKHYGIFACDGCAGFFKRSIRRNRQYICKAKAEGQCIVDKTHRNQCRACRLQKCQEAGMNKDAVQHERGPRNSTLRRHMALYFKDSEAAAMMGGSGPILDLAMVKSASSSPRMEHHQPHSTHLMQPSPFMCNPTPHIPRLPLNIHQFPPPPTVMPTMMTPDNICESAARLLFMNVKWAKNVPAFTALPMTDQLLLLEESWRELFVLGAAQFLVPIELGPLVHNCGSLEREPEKAVVFLHQVKEFQETLSKISQFQVDPHEFACLRAIVLFKTSFDAGSTATSGSAGASASVSTPTSSPVPSPTGSTTVLPPTQPSLRTLTDPLTVTTLQDHTQLTLNKYICTAHPAQPLRFGKLLLLLPALRTVQGNTIEELFFRRTIGNIPIVRIICDMYKTTTI